MGAIAPTHTVAEWKYLTNPPTCTAGATREGTCIVCGRTVTEWVDPTPHPFGEWKTVVAATESSSGVQIHFCTICGQYGFREIPYEGPGVTPPKQSDVSALKAIYDQIPAKSQWNQFIDTTALKKAYDTATDMLNHPSDYSQAEVDAAVISLRSAWTAMRCHTTGIRIDKNSAECTVGETVTLKVTLSPAKAGDSVQWSSSAPSVVTVTGAGENHTIGTVTVLENSDEPVTITAKSNGQIAVCTISIVKSEEDEQDEEPKGFFAKIRAFFQKLIDKIKSIFKHKESDE